MRGLVIIGVLAGLAMVAGACSSASTADQTAPVAATGQTRPSATGEFIAQCPFSHRSPDDPLVHPRHNEMSAVSEHSHDFFGNTTTDDRSTIASLLAAGTTTCDLSQDLSSYWAPTLYRRGEPVEVEQFVAYYDIAPGIDPVTVSTMPAGLSIIAGYDKRPGAPATAGLGWACGRSREVQPEPPTCRFRAPLTLRLIFPDCWNGRDTDSADHRSHMTYSLAGSCPASHPVPIVRLVLSVRYRDAYGDPADFTLSSGPLHTAHADFMNAWTEKGLAELVDLCIRRRVTCGVA